MHYLQIKEENEETFQHIIGHKHPLMQGNIFSLPTNFFYRRTDSI